MPSIERQAQTAGVIAEWLNAHPAISAVNYAGLKSHPGHEIALRQQRGFGAMLSFEFEGGVEAVRRFIAALEGIVLAESLGGIESLISHLATMTHASMDQAARKLAGISDGLLRLSVGLEHETDLIIDLAKALDALAEV